MEICYNVYLKEIMSIYSKTAIVAKHLRYISKNCFQYTTCKLCADNQWTSIYNLKLRQGIILVTNQYVL